MAQLNIYVVPTATRLLPKTVNLATDTVDNLIAKLRNANEIPPPPLDGGGNVTIWKMTKGGPGNRILGNYPGSNITDGDLVYLIAVPA